MIKTKSEVVAFVDKDKAGTMVDKVPVFDISAMDFNKKIPYIVTATYDFTNICNAIRMYDKDVPIISLDEILESKPNGLSGTSI